MPFRRSTLGLVNLRALLLPLLAAASLAAPAGAAADVRIVGGTDAPEGTYDAVANVSIANLFGCTGTLIAPEWVLTAGHCGSVTGVGVATPVGWPPGSIQVTLGTTAANGSGGETIIADRVIPAPDYLFTQGYDIALLHLLTPSVQVPVKIAGRGAESLWAAGVVQTIAGFGLTEEDGSSPQTMQVAQVPVVDDATCAATYESFENATQLCAGYKEGGIDSCQGDSGGPLFGHDANGALKVTGATSYGNGCARPNFYGVYARVADATLREWIREVVPEAIDDQVVTSSGGTGTPTGTTTTGTTGGSGTGTSSPTTAPGASPAALDASLAVTRASRSALPKRGVQIRLGCGSSCVGVMDLRVDARTAKRLGLKSTRVGRMTVRLNSAGRVTRRFAIGRKVAVRIAKQRKAKLSVIARVSGDSGGVTLQRRVSLKR